MTLLALEAALKVAKELRIDVSCVELVRARKEHQCKKCQEPIAKGEQYYCIYTGGGLGALKFPDRYHISCQEGY